QVSGAGVEKAYVPRRAEEEVMLPDLLPVRSPHLTRLRRQPREFVGRIVVQPPWLPDERRWKQNVRPRARFAERGQAEHGGRQHDELAVAQVLGRLRATERRDRFVSGVPLVQGWFHVATGSGEL